MTPGCNGAIDEAERQRGQHWAAAEDARRRLDAAHPEVAADRGPRVTQLDASLAELRRLAAPHSTADDVRQRWSIADAATGRHTALLEEQQLRAAMAPQQAALEQGLRMRRQQEQRRTDERHRDSEEQRALDRSREHHDDQRRGQGLDQGPDLGHGRGL